MVLAVIAEGKHPIPFRTRKLRPPTMRFVLPQGGKIAALPVFLSIHNLFGIKSLERSERIFLFSSSGTIIFGDYDMGFIQDFMAYLNEQKIVSVALAFVVGTATAALVQALVKDIITPIYAPYATFLNPATAITIGKSNFLVGDFISQLVSWAVILLVVFIIGKKMMKENKEHHA